MVHAGRLDEVNAYCLCDVAQTAAIFLRVELLRGSFDRARYRSSRADMLAFIDEHPRLGGIAGKINRDSFALKPPAVTAVDTPTTGAGRHRGARGSGRARTRPRSAPRSSASRPRMGARAEPAAPLEPDQSGMFVCFFGGLLSRLSLSISRLRCRRARSVRG